MTQSLKDTARAIFRIRHCCSWRSPVRRVLAALLGKECFVFYPQICSGSVNVECSKCGERERITGKEICAWKCK